MMPNQTLIAFDRAECNETTVDTGPDDDFSLLFAVAFGTPATIIIIVTLVGNFLVLCFRAKVGKRQTMLLIWNLGLADFLVGLVVLPMGVAYVIGRKWPFSRVMCKIWASSDVIFCTASIVTLCIISVDRYIGVTRPLQYKVIVTRGRVVCAIILIWGISIGILLATLRYETLTCVDPTVCIVSNELKYVVHSVITAFMLPAMTTLLLYYRIYQVAKSREQGLRQGLMTAIGGNFLGACMSEGLRVHCGRDAMSQQQKVISMHKKAAKTLGVVVSAFLVCWLPFFSTYLISYHCECVPHVLLDILSWMGYCNSMLNPVIYAFTVEEFKESLKNLGRSIWNFKNYVTCRKGGQLVLRKANKRHSEIASYHSTSFVGAANGDVTAGETHEDGEDVVWNAKAYSMLVSSKTTGL